MIFRVAICLNYILQKTPVKLPSTIQFSNDYLLDIENDKELKGIISFTLLNQEINVPDIRSDLLDPPHMDDISLGIMHMLLFINSPNAAGFC